MPFLIVLVLVLSLFVIGAGLRSARAQTKETRTVTSREVTSSPRSEIEQMLRRIETRPAPEGKMGAMCYDIAPPPEYLEYVCPEDGEKTVFSRKDWEVYAAASSVVEMKRLAGRINETTGLVRLGLDERRLCHKCSPGAGSAERYVVLVTRYPDGRESRYERVCSEDLRILLAFFEKKLSYEGSFGREHPLKEETDKIRKMLGAGAEELPQAGGK